MKERFFIVRIEEAEDGEVFLRYSAEVTRRDVVEWTGLNPDEFDALSDAAQEKCLVLVADGMPPEGALAVATEPPPLIN